MTNLSNIQNPGSHVHLPTTVDGQQVCMSCNTVLIKPLLTTEDVAAANRQPVKLWLDAIKSLCPKPIDFLWIELCERLGIDWPDYIDKLSTRYGGENPPHTEQGSTRWD
jgi:hypothetical protein